VPRIFHHEFRYSMSAFQNHVRELIAETLSEFSVELTDSQLDELRGNIEIAYENSHMVSPTPEPPLVSRDELERENLRLKHKVLSLEDTEKNVRRIVASQQAFYTTPDEVVIQRDRFEIRR
jgi:hypothetical protein